jgi:hypothetical protein
MHATNTLNGLHGSRTSVPAPSSPAKEFAVRHYSRLHARPYDKRKSGLLARVCDLVQPRTTLVHPRTSTATIAQLLHQDSRLRRPFAWICASIYGTNTVKVSAAPARWVCGSSEGNLAPFCTNTQCDPRCTTRLNIFRCIEMYRHGMVRSRSRMPAVPPNVPYVYSSRAFSVVFCS